MSSKKKSEIAGRPRRCSGAGFALVAALGIMSFLVLLGVAKFSLEPGEGSVETPQGHEKNRYYHVMLGTRENGKNRLIKSMKWPHSTTARHYVFFYLDPRKGRVTYRAVDEFLTR